MPFRQPIGLAMRFVERNERIDQPLGVDPAQGVQQDGELPGTVAAWTKRRNASQTGVDWQFTVAGACIVLKRLYSQIMVG